MSCPTNMPGPFECPTLEQSIAATAALWPEGKAWPVRDLAMLPRFLQWLGALAGIPAPSAWPAGFVQMEFTAAVGAVRNFLETQLCALRLEFWCATETLTNDLWMAEYGLPDECEPFPDLCVKVAALGGRRCELYQQLVASQGWLIDCIVLRNCVGVGSYAGSGYAGNIMLGGRQPAAHVVIVVYLGLSPAYLARSSPAAAGGSSSTVFLAGRIFAGQMLACAASTIGGSPPPPDITPVQCLIERIVPAHVVVAYVTQWAPG